MKTLMQSICTICLSVGVQLIIMVQMATAGFPSRSPYTALADTSAFSIPFVIYPNGLYYSFGANFGVCSGATKGIDPSLGEVEYPPFPPCCAFMMFVTTGGNAILDLRPYISPTQIDTYTVGVSAESLSYPIVFSWPDLHQYYGGSVRLKSDLNGSLFDIDMKAKTSYSLTSGPFIHDNGGPPSGTPVLVLYIVAEGPIIIGDRLPIVSTYGLSNGGFQAIVSAPARIMSLARSAMSSAAGTTNVWFEYGPTKGYGTSTSPQAVTNGTNADVTQPFDPSSLPLNTRIHFRSVAQNSLGTFYGGDRVVSNGNPPPEVADTSGNVMYRTATYRDWADAKDTKNKRLSLKPKPDRVAFTIGIQCKTAGVSDLNIVFGAAIDTEGIDDPLTVTPEADNVTSDSKLETWHISWSSPLTSGDSVHISGIAWGGKALKVTKYTWGNPPGNSQKDYVYSGTLGLPMPNLHNVGEGIYGGVKQTSVDITIGVNDDSKGAHTVYHPQYADVIKSFVKAKKGGDLYHTKAPHWLSTFDKNGHPILKRQKSLPPDIHNNILFAEALTLKLNVAASDSGIFPKGLGDLLYSNSTPFDGKSIRQIVAEVDSFLGRPPEPPEVVTDSSIYLKIVQDINSAFEGPMDTVSWSGGKVICTGVKMLKDVPYLYAVSSTTPGIAMGRGPASGPVHRPSEFRLDQNFPNPFNPTTTLGYSLPVESKVRLIVYNTIGQVVATVVNGVQMAGNNSIEWNASTFASGIYFYRIEATSMSDPGKTFTQVKKMILMK